MGTPYQPSLPTSGLMVKPGASRGTSAARKVEGSSSAQPTMTNQSAVLARVMNFLRPVML